MGWSCAGKVEVKVVVKVGLLLWLRTYKTSSKSVEQISPAALSRNSARSGNTGMQMTRLTLLCGIGSHNEITTIDAAVSTCVSSHKKVST